MMKPMTVHFFTFGDARWGSSRQRAFKIADELRARGYAIALHTPPVLFISTTPWPAKGRLIWQTVRSLSSIRKGDIVFLQRAIANKYFFAIMAVYLALFRRRMIFDIDDPIWTHSFLKTALFAKMADAVITCTHTQAEWARRYNKNVHIIHIGLELPSYEKFTKRYADTPAVQTIGWVGTGPEHLRNLEVLAGVFKKLVPKAPAPFAFVLIGALKNQSVYDLFAAIPGLTVRFIDSLDWTDPESVPRELQKFDIGVVPHRSEGEWNKNKTSFKVLEYMACGVAVVSSEFGELPYVIEDGVNGFLARTEDEWVEKLSRLLSDTALSARLGRAGQARVREAYSYDVLVPMYESVIKSVASAR